MTRDQAVVGVRLWGQVHLTTGPELNGIYHLAREGQGFGKWGKVPAVNFSYFSGMTYPAPTPGGVDGYWGLNPKGEVDTGDLDRAVWVGWVALWGERVFIHEFGWRARCAQALAILPMLAGVMDLLDPGMSLPQARSRGAYARLFDEVNGA